MFDIGFTELLLIGIVSLIVIGPERLPSAVRTATLWIGRAKRSFNQVKSEIEREVNADEIRRQLHNEAIMADLNKAKHKADKLVNDTKEGIESIQKEAKETLDREQKELQDAGNSLKEELTIAPPNLKKTDTSQGKKDEPEPSTEPAESESKSSEPVEDFYNNPPKGKVEMQGGSFKSVPEESEEEQVKKDSLKQDES